MSSSLQICSQCELAGIKLQEVKWDDLVVCKIDRKRLHLPLLEQAGLVDKRAGLADNFQQDRLFAADQDKAVLEVALQDIQPVGCIPEVALFQNMLFI